MRSHTVAAAAAARSAFVCGADTGWPQSRDIPRARAGRDAHRVGGAREHTLERAVSNARAGAALLCGGRTSPESATGGERQLRCVLVVRGELGRRGRLLAKSLVASGVKLQLQCRESKINRKTNE